MLYARAADVVVLVHVTFIAFVLVGGFLAWRWPRVVWAHVPAALVIGVLFAFGADCPLTNLEKFLRRQAGDAVYRDGFVAHYLLPGVPDGVRAVVLPIFVVSLTVIAYARYLARSGVSRTATTPDRRSARRHRPVPAAADTRRQVSSTTTRPSRAVRRGS